VGLRPALVAPAARAEDDEAGGRPGADDDGGGGPLWSMASIGVASATSLPYSPSPSEIAPALRPSQ
jgi:hypothetical protein